VQPDPHPDRTACKAGLRIRGSRHCIGGAAKCHEESVALGVDLDPVTQLPRFAQHTPVLGKHLGIPVTQLREQPRRPLDVGEQERHGPGRELGLHPSILSRRAPDYQGALDLLSGGKGNRTRARFQPALTDAGVAPRPWLLLDRRLLLMLVLNGEANGYVDDPAQGDEPAASSRRDS
jgi:hypothetical protein